MLSVPNILSCLRMALALVFLQDNVTLRVIAILLASLTDALDGFLARRLGQTSQLGALLDPAADKCFAFCALFALAHENHLSFLEVMAFLCRDFAVMLFGLYLIFKRRLQHYHFRSIWCGKITTVLQLIVLMGLTLKIPLPPAFFISFVVLGVLAFVELAVTRHSKTT
jgi:CDP-diacylglycerol--glycerol-3-phosphate 3-phosphatidyltransferase